MVRGKVVLQENAIVEVRSARSGRMETRGCMVAVRLQKGEDDESV
jgi:hypothetical protein